MFHAVSINLIGRFCCRWRILIHIYCSAPLKQMGWSRISILDQSISHCLIFHWHVFSRHGSPNVLLSDNWLNFTFQAVTKLSILFSIYPTFAGMYHPATNGSIEREKGTLKYIVCKMTSYNPTCWPTYLEKPWWPIKPAITRWSTCLSLKRYIANTICFTPASYTWPPLLDITLLMPSCNWLQMNKFVSKPSPPPRLS